MSSPINATNGASSNDLFGSTQPAAPLAERLRPRSLSEVVGQTHLLAPGKPLRVSLESARLHSMILWGPPGVGKTTLAGVLARGFNAEFIAISAVLAGIKEIRDAVRQAELVLQQSSRPTILFVDEVHRFNKAQQDAFLPHVERGLLTFIGATTENPSFEVNSALLSRAAVYVLHPLAHDELAQLLQRALLECPGLATLSTVARRLVIDYADGDARRLLNMVEQLDAALTVSPIDAPDEEWIRGVLAQGPRRFDKGGDQFYDQISALHKSVRGSAPDAALYWMCRMLDGGADPLYIARRMVRMASEDVGLADPRALRLALDACETYERLGSPEGELALAQAVLYLAVAPKSNATYVAYLAARELVRNDASRPVPDHLRNAPTKLMKELGHGRDYRYAHDEPGAYAAGENYLPEGMVAPNFYRPVDHGLEGRIRARLEELQLLDQQGRGGKS